ncbi:TIGR00282 family metallophosphoesterase [Candidatus Marinarcus aquaticus]|uniref:TIGR00282 family metallophosphoesterase n=1 Tax=Candidatus Marinarcus aquaticus TaxID=2044504 RepID=A0A4Q0XSX8_9BACT|nr:TIGR00282 family metallophosphoesterase [Candidatus Marinarcus aquaticus]RXJ57531.1 TIGR00282 family metallophosphoesterase [Candidatus Marinarcus aquaticus]
MRIAFIGDIVGRPGRKIIKDKLKTFINKYEIDYVIANGENASHGFGLTIKNCDELIKSGIDLFTGGNHSFDKRTEVEALFKTKPVLRPDNYPEGIPGKGVEIVEIKGEKLAIVNLMGMYSMPHVENPFNWATKLIDSLHEEGIKNIFIDFHAEATSEKRVMHMMFEGKISAILGTHTHVGTDDLQILNGTAYVTDVGLTGCRDNVIGMDKQMPIYRATTGLNGHFKVPSTCKAILQFVVMDIENGQCHDAFKLKAYCDISEELIIKALFE